MANITFVEGANTLTFTRSPLLATPDKDLIPQAIGETAGGKIYAYQKGPAYREWVLEFEDIPEGTASPMQNYLGLREFFKTHAVGGSQPLYLQ